MRWSGDPFVRSAPEGLARTEIGTFLRSARATALYAAHVERVVGRTNTVTGVAYRDDPTIVAWELVNEISRLEGGDPASRFAVETAVSLIQPYAPHAAEELWSRLGRSRLWAEPWPVADATQLERELVELVVQVNGKVRDRLQVPAGLPDDELVAAAKGSPKVATYLDGEEPRAFVVPDKLVNLVV